ncbi:60Kd inner membrane protein-domain-containing protein [Suillus subaureus]|uniref:60Kd inner membrane protein-domain-containing protein n=1 Tax=Suillus subaureus TaxID=48587 RepID=A0A9P7EBS5_9AGAM|nr:60Kd inner membrane protein-domain-containing protein [Suillus subaureus]KAG1816692.1 60Kd inner membrane protein-domain-containing protein [Suillus subaureus]
MLLPSTVRVGIRLNPRVYGARIWPQASQNQGLFLTLPHSKIMPRVYPSQRIPHTRNFWWSKSAIPEQQAASAVESAPTSSSKVSPAAVDLEPATTINTATLEPDSVPIPGTTAEDGLTTVVDSGAGVDIPALATAIPPLQYGDLAELGLAGWSPAGIIRWSFELLQVSSGMPWFYTIIAGTLLWRVVILPANIMSLRNSSRLLPYTDQLQAVTSEWKSIDTSDRLALQRISLKRQKIYEKAGARVLPSIIMPFVQIPVTLGLFFAVRKMTMLPVEQLKQSGVFFLPDLTMSDPYYILPILSTVAINIQMSVMKGDVNFAERPEMAHMMNYMRIFSFMSVPLMGSLPSGLWLSILTGVMVSCLQSFILQRATVRRWLKITPRAEPKVKPPSMMDSMQYAKSWYMSKRSEIIAARTQAAKTQRR